MAGNAAESGRTVTSKVTAILLAFSRGNQHTLTELATLTGLPVSTAHRLAAELTSRRLLDRTDDGGYRIGLPLRVIAGGRAGDLAQPLRLWDRAADVMTDLAAVTRSPVRLGVLHGDDIVEAGVHPGRAPSSARVSARPPHATALGRALLAFSPPALVERMLEGAPVPDGLRRSLGATRLSHLAMIRTGRTAEDGQEGGTVAMPVFGAGGVLLAALELGVADLRVGLDGARAALVVATGSLSRTLATAPDDGRA